MIYCIGTGTSRKACKLCKQCHRFSPIDKTPRFRQDEWAPVNYDESSDSCPMYIPLHHNSLGFVFSPTDLRMHARAVADAHKFMTGYGRGHSIHLVRDENAYFGSSLHHPPQATKHIKPHG